MLNSALKFCLVLIAGVLVLTTALPLVPVNVNDMDLVASKWRALSPRSSQSNVQHAKVTFIPANAGTSAHLPQNPQKVKNAIHTFLKIALPGLDTSGTISSIRVQNEDWEGEINPSETAIKSDETQKRKGRPGPTQERYHYEQGFWLTLPVIGQAHQEKEYEASISWESHDRTVSGNIRDAEDHRKVFAEVEGGILIGPQHLLTSLKKDNSESGK
ncbi:hypothetical protein F5890DRAFT_112760 [Lentinula detonsa]|uniref:Uncharacterized protein n=1 Tax=Lentinula detonsa TaxID=2804962 RepID=A0AA38PY77_9AGAR|nr:hypothetical protein F5890DRAFT_112760 [Lentinula detonsa]